MELLKNYEGGYVVLPLEAYESLKAAANRPNVNIDAPSFSEMVKKAIAKEEQKIIPAKEKKEVPKDKKRVDHGKVNALHKAGWSAAKIADEMGISVATVYNHIDKEQ